MISRTPYSVKCDWFTKVRNAQQANATGVIVYSDPGEPLIDMNCQSKRFPPPYCEPTHFLVFADSIECNTQLNIPGTMITFQAGLSLRALLDDPTYVSCLVTSERRT